MQALLYRISRGRARTALAITAVVSLAAATAIAVPATFGAFTAQTKNPTNKISSGTLTMANDHNGSYILQGTNIAPGDSGAVTVTITNTGSLAATMTLNENPSSGWTSYGQCADGSANCGDLSGLLTLTIQDVDATGHVLTTPFTGVFNGVGSFTLQGTGGGKWAPGEAHHYRFSWSFPTTADNTYQGTRASADFTFNASS